MCKTCIFGPAPIELSPERMVEIQTYLANFSSSHICHTTNKTCYGALEFQAQLLFKMGVIAAPTVEVMLAAAALFLRK